MAGLVTSETRTFASLGHLLLARKGAASPAIKPQIGEFGSADLLGDINALEHDDSDEFEHESFAAGAEPEIVRQQEALAGRIVKFGAAQLASPAEQSPAQEQAQPRTRKVAFTLRLDPERHLRLKLASTLEGISAQQLVTRALDRLLADMPQVEPLAQHLKRK